MSTFIVPEDIVQTAPSGPALLDDTEARRRYGRLMQASASAARTLGELRERFGQDTDWTTAPGRFRDAADAIGRQHANGLADDRTGRALFLRDFASLADTHAAAFERENDAHEHAALQDAYQARMEGLGQLARAGGGEHRKEILRQAALEAHRAHAFGLEADPAAAMERFTVEITPRAPMGNSFGAPDGVPADRDAFESQAQDGWRHRPAPKAETPRKDGKPLVSAVQAENSLGAPTPASADRQAFERSAREDWHPEAGPKTVPGARKQPVLDADRASQAFGVPDSPLTERDRGRYTDVQNTGEPRAARTPENIGKDYWAAKKALDVEPNDPVAQAQLSEANRELDLYVIREVLATVLGEEAEDTAIGIGKLRSLAPPWAKLLLRGDAIVGAPWTRIWTRRRRWRKSGKRSDQALSALTACAVLLNCPVVQSAITLHADKAANRMMRVCMPVPVFSRIKKL